MSLIALKMTLAALPEAIGGTTGISNMAMAGSSGDWGVGCGTCDCGCWG